MVDGLSGGTIEIDVPGGDVAMRDGLVALSDGAMRWLGEAVAFLDPALSDLPVTPRVKACVELALLCRIWTRLAPDDKRLRPVAAAVRRIWQSPDFPDQIDADPNYARQAGLTYVALAPAGLSTGYHEATREKLAPGGRLARYGKSPHLHLSTRYYADLAGIPHEFDSYRELYERTVLANLASVEPPMNHENTYRITHTLFHLSDFGLCDLDLPAAERERIAPLIDELTGHAVETEHWDLTEELLLSQFIVGLDPTRTRSGVAGIRSLLAAQLPNGAIPGRFAAQRVDESVPPILMFRRSYHTTLVAALVSLVILSARENH